MGLSNIKPVARNPTSTPPRPTLTGPRTEKGQLRASLNATKQCLAGKHLLLPGEASADYEQRMDAVFEALHPEDDVQAQVVALVADDLWKLDRLGRSRSA